MILIFIFISSIDCKWAKYQKRRPSCGCNHGMEEEQKTWKVKCESPLKFKLKKWIMEKHDLQIDDCKDWKECMKEKIWGIEDSDDHDMLDMFKEWKHKKW